MIHHVPGLTTHEAARRLGVKVETLYAYVSRGLVQRERSADGRSSFYDARAIEDLARRGRPRQSSRSTSLNMLIETRLTSLSPHGVRYRGVPSSELAVTHTFEEVADWLWLGTMPDTMPGTSTAGPWAGEPIDVPVTGDLVGALRVAAAIASTRLPMAEGRDAPSVAASGRRLIATLTDSLPRVSAGRVPQLVLPGAGEERRAVRDSIAGRLWLRLSPQRPQPGMLTLLNATLVLLADHELAASTLAVRVAASTWADPTAVVMVGQGALSGPLHGGASVAVRAMLERATEIGAARAVAEVVDSGQRIPGFGHKVYVDADPRAVVLLRLLREVSGRTRALSVVDDVHDAVRQRLDKAANVDFALASMAMVGGMPADGGEVVMGIARIAGWLAHAIEEYQEAPLRFRPRASYIGP
ncbi:MAG: binding domain protein excisionase family [Ilumatobacteraceae bacterium]|nr:binding domain protein excisionase family [Ilumatobacteraceae bacterium]